MIQGTTKANSRKFTISTSLLAISVCAGLAGTASAQDAADASDTAIADDSTIVVTGSRIGRPVLDLPTPVGVVTSDALENNNAQFDIGRALAQQPSIGFSGSMQQSQQTGASGSRGENSGGLAVVDLRSLGSNRTLVLVNGKRRVAGATDSAAIDLNSINPNLIERIEVITGGASAIYGSDAVSGVVNVILKENFDGVRVSVNGSQPARGPEGFTYGGSLVAGKNFGDGRGNITFAADYTKVQEITPAQAGMKNNVAMLNPADTGPNDGIPDMILAPGAEALRFSGYGVVGFSNDTGGLGRFAFNDDGTVRPFPTPSLTDGSLFGIFENCGAACFRFDDSISIVPEIERYNINMSANYDFSDSVSGYFRVDYNNTSSLGRGQPVIRSGTPINVAQNAFLNEDFRQDLLAAGATTVRMDRLYTDLGLRYSQVDRNSLSFVGGFKGEVETGVSNLRYDVYATYGRTKAKFIGYNRLLVPNLNAALDSVIDPDTGEAACRMNVPALQPPGYTPPSIVGNAACAPFNPFGSVASSQEARDFVTTTTVSDAFVRQTTAGFSLAGDTAKFLTMPGGGAVGFALGAEYREERNGRTTDPLVKAGLTNQAATQDYEGGYHVTELFGELNVPILSDVSFAKLLSVEGAVRHADYSHAGQATSWKAGTIWEPTDGLRLRATISRAIRAPNIFEAFRPSEGQTTNVNDPCAQTNLGLNPNRAANCAALGRPSGFVPLNGGIGVPFIVSGNENLRPEVSDSWTAGFVFTPAFLPGLQLSVDWFNIEIDDAISFLSPQQIAENCVDRAGGPDLDLCALITRESNTASPNFFGITTGNSTYVNTSKLETSGLDTQLFYAHPVGSGRISANLAFTYLHRLRTYTFQSRPDLYTVLEGFYGYPKYKSVLSMTYANGPLTLGWQGRYQSSQALTDRSPGISRELLSPDRTGSRFYNDISASYTLPMNGRQEAKFSFGVSNLFNEKLPDMESVQVIDPSGGGFDQFGPVIRLGLDVNF
ncbi:TonB-dependent receptor domain-containing protein [Sphingosinicella soli]|uniref:Outer membrane receptor protein involved in Fe transport n=1 Tax=Sphingosinicella soli TaxID=333708 RepID=A0A7W7AYU7_9SPHN|nr:TonB-dependent receptor [Sphingosinicella soli]MBB4630895.1 outer membrane receptor protein involved in Fe transport [Sphingosinicella soli]